MSDQLIEFAQLHSIDIDRLYIDRFWLSLYSDKWIHIDDDIMTWIGYDETKLREGKRYLLNKLRLQFQEGTDFKLISVDDIDQHDYISHIDSSSINANKVLIVDPDVFKELLLCMNTNKARQVQKYYIQIEKLCRMFMREQLSNQSIQAPQIPRMRLDLNEVVYIASSNTHAQSNLFKIGRTKNLKSRIRCMNTSNPDREDDRLRAFLVIKCFDSKSLEAMIHAHLDAYRHSDSKEWFNIDYAKLIKAVEHFSQFAQASIDMVNSLDQSAATICNELAIEPEAKPLIKSMLKPAVIEVKKHASGRYKCSNCNRSWAADNQFYHRHIQFCK